MVLVDRAAQMVIKLEFIWRQICKHRIIFFPKVVGAKVVTNARSPGARCYGFVTMSTSEEATKCISHLHRTELHGKMISVEKVSGSYSMTV